MTVGIANIEVEDGHDIKYEGELDTDSKANGFGYGIIEDYPEYSWEATWLKNTMHGLGRSLSFVPNLTSK